MMDYHSMIRQAMGAQRPQQPQLGGMQQRPPTAGMLPPAMGMNAQPPRSAMPMPSMGGPMGMQQTHAAPMPPPQPGNFGNPYDAMIRQQMQAQAPRQPMPMPQFGGAPRPPMMGLPPRR